MVDGGVQATLGTDGRKALDANALLTTRLPHISVIWLTEDGSENVPEDTPLGQVLARVSLEGVINEDFSPEIRLVTLTTLLYRKISYGKSFTYMGKR